MDDIQSLRLNVLHEKFHNQDLILFSNLSMGFNSNIRDSVERKVKNYNQIPIYFASNAFPSTKHLIGEEEELNRIENSPVIFVLIVEFSLER